MAKNKRKPVEFHAGIARGAFWPGVPKTQEGDVADEKLLQEEAAVPADENTASEPPKLRKVFNELVKAEEARTRFKADRLEFYLPPELISSFNSATFTGSQIKLNDDGQKLIDFITHNIYGALPDYDAPAKEEQANGLQVTDKVIDLLMARKTVTNQMREMKVDHTVLRREADIKLKDQFSPSTIREAILGGGNKGVSRKLVANLMIIASELEAAEPK